MDFFTSMNISSSALTAERTRMNLISGNLANASTTRTPEGGAVQTQGCGFLRDPLGKPFQQGVEQRCRSAGAPGADYGRR